MKVLASGLQAHLDTGATTLCECWRIETKDGLVLGFTSHDHDLTFGNVTYGAQSGFSASEIETSLGLSVDNLDAQGALTAASLNEADLLAGRFDDADVEIWLVNWQQPDQRLLQRKGNLGEVERTGDAFSAEVRGLAHRLNQPAGRSYQFTCDADVGDARCSVALNTPAFQVSASVASVTGNRRILALGLAGFATGWFDQGTVLWTTGANAGRTMEVKSHRVTAAGVMVVLWQKMSEAVAAGDQFTITAGCDKTFATCRAKFSNGDNFRGFPHMPGNDFLTYYPNSGDTGNDGASRQ